MIADHDHSLVPQAEIFQQIEQSSDLLIDIGELAVVGPFTKLVAEFLRMSAIGIMRVVEMNPAEERKWRGSPLMCFQPRYCGINDETSVSVAMQLVVARFGGRQIIIVNFKTAIEAKFRLQHECRNKGSVGITASGEQRLAIRVRSSEN